MPRSKSLPSSRSWCFTLNNYTADDESMFQALNTKYLVFGKETSSSGTPHLQGFAYFPNAKTLNGVRSISSGSHWEIAKGSAQQAAEYCKKDGNFFESGSLPHQGKRTDLDSAIDTLKTHGVKRVAQEHPKVFLKYSRGFRDLALMIAEPYEHATVRGIWIYGPPGTGKSYAARRFDPNLYVKAQNKWFDGYDGEETILLDDLDTPVLAHHLKIWADKYACTGETKGGTVHLRHRLFVVTCNFSIDELFAQEHDSTVEALHRRFKSIYKEDKNELVDFLVLK